MSENAQSHVVVIGAGLAGLSCALRLADNGARVTLFESRPRIGGATWSFERNGLNFDNGQHVFLRCCTEYQAFLSRIGSSSHAPVQSRLHLPVVRPSTAGGAPTVSWISSSKLPAPAHLMPSLFSYSHLRFSDRMRVGRAVLALQKLSLDDASLDDVSFGTFLEKHGQSSDAIAALWDLITLPTVNVHAADASLALAAKVFKTGLLEDRSAADIGWSRVPLSKLHGDPAVRALEGVGVKVHSRAKVSLIETTHSPSNSVPSGASAVIVDGERIDADAVVLAVPHEQAIELLPKEAGLDANALTGLGRSPIIDVHVVYDRKVMDFDVAAGYRTPVQYVFDRTDAAGLDPSEGQCVAVSVSNADAEHGERAQVLIDRYTKALSDLFPAARTATVLDAVVSREHAATFRGIPGTAHLRPATTTDVPNLFLAGAWVDTGWPATMEGAVKSGNSAATHTLRSLGSSRIEMTDKVPA